jgi:hypothetical protein
MVTSIDILGWLVLWRVLFWKCPAVVPWATVDVESGSIKTWILSVGSTPLIIRILQKCFWENTLIKWTLACVKPRFIANEPRPYPWYVLCMIFIIPLRGCGWTCWVRMYSLLPCFYRGGYELHSWRHRVGHRPTPNLACGLGSPQEAYHGTRLW